MRRQFQNLILAGSLCCLPAWPLAAQEVPQPPLGTVLREVVPQVTGRNGYEELILASEMVQRSALFYKVQEQGASLTLKKQTLADPPIVQALAMLRAGLAKTVTSPRKPDTLDENTRLPEFAGFRNLARLLLIEQYVLLSEGKISAAIDTTRDGLRMGYLIQTDTLISGLVGVAIDAVSLSGVGRSVPQCSFRDSTQLLQLIREWTTLESPIARVLESERDGNLRILRNYREKADQFFSAFQDEQNPEVQNNPLYQQLKANPEKGREIFDQAIPILTDYYNALIENVKRPPTQRKEIAVPKGKSPVYLLTETLLPALGNVVDKYDREQAQLRVLGVQAAIQRYRWVYDRLPKSLAELRLEGMERDPFSGRPLVYIPEGDSYELYSEGPYARDDDGKVLKTRERVYFPPRPRNNG